jgi:hypothetical protein
MNVETSTPPVKWSTMWSRLTWFIKIEDPLNSPIKSRTKHTIEKLIAAPISEFPAVVSAYVGFLYTA